MTSATVATKPAAAQSGQSQAKPEKIRKDHSINWWLTAAVAVLSLTVLVPLYFAVVTALKTPGEAGTFSLPTTWEWHNFADAFRRSSTVLVSVPRRRPSCSDGLRKT